MKNKALDCFTVGFALFSILFGAGNLIFPTYIGAISGKYWFLSFLLFILADVGLVFIGISAYLKNDSDSNKIFGVIGNKNARILEIVMLVCLILISAPRSAATAFEIALPNSNMLMFSALYFSVAIMLSIKSTKVVDIVGKILTPILLTFLLIFIIMGITNSNTIFLSNTSISESIKLGWKTGYQTLDILCITIVVDMLIKSLKSKGYKSHEYSKMILYASIIAIMGISLVYCGLSYLGAINGALYNGTNQADFLVTIANLILKDKTFILSIIVLCACLTTAIGIASAGATYFSKITNIKYNIWIIIISVACFIVSNFGLSNIIRIANPILSIIYPVILVLLVLSFFKIKNTHIHKLAVLGALLVSILAVINEYCNCFDFIKKLPLYSIGFEWITIAIIFGLIGTLIKQKNKKD